MGWSKDGKLAYVVEHNHAAMGVGPVFEWIIQDMVSDEVVWTSKPNPEQWAAEHPQTEGLLGAQALRVLFPEMLAQHRASLQRYGIVAGPAPLFARFPVASGGLRFESTIRDVRRGEAFETEDAILAYRVVAVRSDKRAKALSTVARDSEEWPVLDVQVAGYIQSPYQARIAVVLCATSRGWEGPPHPVSFSLVGCNLKTGFK